MFDLKGVAKKFINRLGYEVRKKPSNFSEKEKLIQGVMNQVAANTPEGYEIFYQNLDLLDERFQNIINFYRQVIEIVSAYRPKTLIDVGCGGGHFLLECSKHIACELYGLDLSPSGVAHAQKLIPAAKIEQASIFNAHAAFPGKTFDVVCCIEVLEHLDEPGKAIVELIKLKSHSGKLVLTVPDGRKDTWEGHVNFWSEQSLAVFLRNYGKFRVRALSEALIATEM
jgi:2-polyprenyl-3-methyl-5-hydroxy-6-metoxy-1,4-benzoquinol methylase